jgi:hypothetical protein
MTIEAALTKMFVVLGGEPNVDIAADKLQINLKGEQRQSIFNLHFAKGEIGEDDAPKTVAPLRPMVGGKDLYDSNKLDRAVFRIMGLRTADGKRGRIEFKAYIDLPEANASTKEEGNPRYLGKGDKRFESDEHLESVFLTVTDQVRNFVDNSHPNTITIVGMGRPFSWQKLNVAFFAD